MGLLLITQLLDLMGLDLIWIDWIGLIGFDLFYLKKGVSLIQG